MIRRYNTRKLWFGAFLFGGIVIGLVLLAQTVSTYVYVSGNLVTQAGLREADQRLGSVQRALRRVDGTDVYALNGVLAQSRAEADDRVSWLRIVKPDGTTMASDGEAVGEPVSFRSLREAMDDRGTFYETRETPDGSVLVTVSPVRLDVGKSNESGAGFALMEIAVPLDQFEAGFVYLRANLVIGVSAALILLGTLFLIRLRLSNYLQGEQLESEVALARAVQDNLLPSTCLTSSDADVAAVCQPALHMGGDFYDVFDTDQGRLALMLGDVSGKGIAASPLMGFIYGAAHASAWTESTYDHEAATRGLNDLLYRKTSTDRFVSMLWSYFDRDAAKLRYVNAGHLPALRLRKGAAGIEVTRLTEGGPVLGVVPGASYTQGVIDVDPGDILLVFSDGIEEAVDAFDQQFGDERIAQAASMVWDGTSEQIRDGILSQVREFTQSAVPDDDRTLIVLRFEHVAVPDRDETCEAVFA
jgi:serine phosphatase RsbU (regulator of sigma subunit)